MLGKGFIGSIGDDIPSLIPLLFALVIFFSTFTFAFRVFEEKNTQFQDQLSVMSIGRVLQSSSYVGSADKFEALCKSINVTNMNYFAIITNAHTAPEVAGTAGRGIDIFNPVIFAETGTGKEYVCSNIPQEQWVKLNEASDKKLIARIFPLAVEDNKVVKPMHLVVVAWN